MAVVQLVVTLGVTPAGTGVPLSASVKGVGDPIAGFPDDTAVNDAVAVLVSDGASPTQAHVTDLAGAWTTYQTAASTYTAGTLTGNVTVSFNTSQVTTRNQLRVALDAIMRAAESGMGGLTP